MTIPSAAGMRVFVGNEESLWSKWCGAWESERFG
jgi:hypothetical protein